MGFDSRLRALRRAIRHNVAIEEALAVSGFKLADGATPPPRATRQVRKSARDAGLTVITDEMRKAERAEKTRLAKIVATAKGHAVRAPNTLVIPFAHDRERSMVGASEVPVMPNSYQRAGYSAPRDEDAK